MTETTLRITAIGGPTTLIEIDGVRLLTDPTFDPPGDYQLAPGRVLTKTAPPALPAASIGPVDAVLLSHDQHADNLDTAGRALLADAPLVLTTPLAAERLGGSAVGMQAGDTRELVRRGGGVLRVTAVPALHGPAGSEPYVGPVTGFVLSGDGVPTVYVSGDNASLDCVREVADRHGPFDVAVLFAGRARTALLGDADLTLSSVDAAQAAELLGARYVVPAHFEQWKHFTEGRDELRKAFADAGRTERLVLLDGGEAWELPAG